MKSQPIEQPHTMKSLRRTRQASLHEVVHRLADIHRRLSERYAALSLQTPNERVRLVLEFLAGHEVALAKYLREFAANAPETVIQRRFKYVPDLDSDDLFVLLGAAAPASPDDLAALLQEVHQSIDAVYTPLNNALLPEDLGDAVEKLRLQEREHAIAQLRAAMDE